MKWFKHDTDALQDAKIEKLVMKYGLEGYGLYFACVELIAAALSADDCSFELEHDEILLAHKFKKTPNKIKEMLAYMLEIGLFQYNDQTKRLMCIQLLKRVDNTMAQNPEIRKIMNNGDFKKLKETLNNLKSFEADKIRTDKNKNRTDTDTEKKLKVAPSVFLTTQETEKIVKQYGKPIYEKAVKKLSQYKESTGKKYKSDYYTILNWVIEEVGGKPKEDLEKKKYPKCPECGKALVNETKNKAPSCYSCGANLAEEDPPFNKNPP